MVEAGSGAAAFLAGRGDVGRTPWFTQTDVLYTHYINVSENVKLLFRINVNNLWDERNATDQFRTLLGPGQSLFYPDLATFTSGQDFRQRIADQHLVTDPRFLQPNVFQTPREARIAFGVKF